METSFVGLCNEIASRYGVQDETVESVIIDWCEFVAKLPPKMQFALILHVALLRQVLDIVGTVIAKEEI